MRYTGLEADHAELSCSTHCQVLVLGVSHARLACCIPWQVQDPGLGVGMIGKLEALPCWAPFPAGGYESQGWV